MPEWITLSKNEGQNDGTVNVTVAKNTGEERQAVLTVKTAGNIQKVLSIIQAKSVYHVQFRQTSTPEVEELIDGDEVTIPFDIITGDGKNSLTNSGGAGTLVVSYSGTDYFNPDVDSEVKVFCSFYDGSKWLPEQNIGMDGVLYFEGTITKGNIIVRTKSSHTFNTQQVETMTLTIDDTEFIEGASSYVFDNSEFQYIIVGKQAGYNVLLYGDLSFYKDWNADLTDSPVKVDVIAGYSDGGPVIKQYQELTTIENNLMPDDSHFTISLNDKEMVFKDMSDTSFVGILGLRFTFTSVGEEIEPVANGTVTAESNGQVYTFDSSDRSELLFDTLFMPKADTDNKLAFKYEKPNTSNFIKLTIL